MLTKRISITGAIVFLVAAVGSARAQDMAYLPKVGAQHPDIVLPRIDTRESVALSQFRGKKVLLIHFASW